MMHFRVDIPSNNEEFVVALYTNVNVEIDWGDGQITSHTGNYPSHIYSTAGDYEVKITGSAERLGATTTGNRPASWRNYLTEFYQVGLPIQSYLMAFSGCHNLSVFSAEDTGSGTNFGHMFGNCTALTTIPEIDTSSGTGFASMFWGCTALTEVPELDTSSGTDFSQMFYGCTTLTTIPEMDTSSGTNFNQMFTGCSSLTTIPELDTSSGTNFSAMFNGCSSLTSVPEMDTSSGTTFSGMFNACSALTVGRLNGTRYTISYAGCNLSRPAIVDIFNGLGTAVGTRTVTFTNNPGTTTVSSAEKNIAKGKGWNTNPS